MLDGGHSEDRRRRSVSTQHVVARSAVRLGGGPCYIPFMPSNPTDVAHQRSSPRNRVREEPERKGPRGLGSMRDIPLNIDPRIDLTKPIYEQVLALEKVDKEAAERGASG